MLIDIPLEELNILQVNLEFFLSNISYTDIKKVTFIKKNYFRCLRAAR